MGPCRDKGLPGTKWGRERGSPNPPLSRGAAAEVSDSQSPLPTDTAMPCPSRSPKQHPCVPASRGQVQGFFASQGNVRCSCTTELLYHFRTGLDKGLYREDPVSSRVLD